MCVAWMYLKVFLVWTWLLYSIYYTKIPLHCAGDFCSRFGAVVPLLRGIPWSRGATCRCTWKHRKRQKEACILLRDHNSVKLYSQGNHSLFHATTRNLCQFSCHIRQWGCAHFGSSTDSQCAQKLFCKGHHLFNILEMGKAPPWSRTVV